MQAIIIHDQGYILRLHRKIPPPFEIVLILPFFAYFFAVIRAYIKQGNKIRIVSLFFNSHYPYFFLLLSSLFPLFSFSPLLFLNSSMFFFYVCPKFPPGQNIYPCTRLRRKPLVLAIKLNKCYTKCTMNNITNFEHYNDSI